MKQFWIKITVFTVIFAILFVGLQQILHYHWPEDTYTRYIDFRENNAPDTVDVFAFGTSEMYAAYSPVATYHQAGITGYNFSIMNRSAMATYYQLMYALKYQTPKVVICDFVCLFDDMLPSESETVYRRTVDTMPDIDIKYDMIREIRRADKDANVMSYIFPILRYHSMWNELTPEDFSKDNVYNEHYQAFKKGAFFNYGAYNGDTFEITPELWDSDDAPAEIADYSAYYYEKMIEECNKRGIKVVFMLTPKVADAAVYAVNYPTMEKWLSERGVTCLNYCTYEQIQRMNLSIVGGDYYDPAHLNSIGCVKFSTYVADDLKALFPELPDRRQDDNCNAQWDSAWNGLTEYMHLISEQ